MLERGVRPVVRRWARGRALSAIAAAVLVLSSGGGAVSGPDDAGRSAGTATPVPALAAAPSAGRDHPPPRPTAPRKLDRKLLTKRIDSYLDNRSGSVSLAVRDLTTGNTYRYRASRRYATASTAKVDILMTLLLQAQKAKRKPSGLQRDLASNAIRHSDNRATDMLWQRIGGASGLTAANRKFGVKRTRATDGKCLDLFCWGITDTTADDQVKLLYALVRDDSPLKEENRRYVLDLMSKVIKEQAWGVSAAARPGERISLKNGWQKRLAHGGLWAVNSIGRVRAQGHDLLIAVLSDHNPNVGYGIKSIERVVEIAGEEFRKTHGRA
jgi:beta-lactamase class A